MPSGDDTPRFAFPSPAFFSICVSFSLSARIRNGRTTEDGSKDKEDGVSPLYVDMYVDLSCS